MSFCNASLIAQKQKKLQKIHSDLSEATILQLHFHSKVLVLIRLPSRSKQQLIGGSDEGTHKREFLFRGKIVAPEQEVLTATRRSPPYSEGLFVL